MSPTRSARLSVSASRRPGDRACQDIVREGSTPQDSNILLEGFVYRYRLLADGRRQITAFHVPGGLHRPAQLPAPAHDHALAAAGPCLVGIVPHACSTRMTETLPHLMRLLWRSTAIDAAIHRGMDVAMGRRSALGSMAHLFCELFLRPRAVGLDSGPERSSITQAELGDLTGPSTVHVNRVAQELRGSGTITWQGRTSRSSTGTA